MALASLVAGIDANPRCAPDHSNRIPVHPLSIHPKEGGDSPSSHLPPSRRAEDCRQPPTFRSKSPLPDEARMDLRDPRLRLSQCLDAGMNGMRTQDEVIVVRDGRAQDEL